MENGEIGGCSLAQWVQKRWSVGGREGGRMGGVDSSYEGRVYDNLAEVEGGGKDSFPSIQRCYQRFHFQACKFQFASFP